jgi:hypothetical protein
MLTDLSLIQGLFPASLRALLDLSWQSTIFRWHEVAIGGRRKRRDLRAARKSTEVEEGTLNMVRTTEISSPSPQRHHGLSHSASLDIFNVARKSERLSGRSFFPA